ncbi:MULTISPECIES: SAF domain-containing protein [Jeotgalibacillus]|uniref:SAF domain-containing protein n=1 Tax=Jeotgalibacillus TaxID=157226 RepID=UPI00106B2E1F|nr:MULTISPECIES: SAF domain-containing protein [Jeotgalibacillus]TFD99382.1 flp pilus assembly protein CpaB [Jeotgalibacillus sp. R-1-5s-1]
MIESKRRALIFFIIAALFAAAAGYFTLQKVRELNSDLGTMVTVYVAGADIAARDVITPDSVAAESIPQKFVTSEHIQNPDELMNKVSVVPLSEGDVISKNMLKEASAVTEENNRLVTLMSSERVFFDEPLEPLDRVDIIVSNRTDEGNQTEIFMKDVKVARVASEEGNFSGVQVEISLDQTPELIHMQNYADSVRIIKANVGLANQEVAGTSQEAEEAPPEEEPAEAEQPAEEKAEEKPPAEEKKEEQKQDSGE